jgi:hypothetical protein
MGVLRDCSASVQPAPKTSSAGVLHTLQKPEWFGTSEGVPPRAIRESDA